MIKWYQFLSIEYSLSNTSFRFRHTFRLSVRSSQSHATSCSSLMSPHRVNIKCNSSNNNSKVTMLKMASLLFLPLFLKVSQFSLENTCVGVSFFLKMMKLYKDVCSACCRNFFLIDDVMKNTIDLLLFYTEHFYEFSGSDLWKSWKKQQHSFHNKHIYIYRSQTYWSFMKFYSVHIVKACFVFKKQPCLYSSVYN